MLYIDGAPNIDRKSDVARLEINFLHYQHDRLVKTHREQRQNATTAAAEQAATVLVHPRSPRSKETVKELSKSAWK